MSEVDYLFRKPGSHVFITPRDTDYRYEFLCGRCEYPVAVDEEKCPRCQVELEDCPVCTRMKHRKVPKLAPGELSPGKACPVCLVRRIPFGEVTLSELKGSFCTNLYDCPAGGLLLRSGEFAVLPEKASLCPVCRNEKLLPLGVEAFAYRLPRCLFCSTCFGPTSSWAKGWLSGSTRIDKLGEVLEQEQSECPLCGRHDYVHEKSGRVWSASVGKKEVTESEAVGADTKGLAIGHFLRVCELGRALILNHEDDDAFESVYHLWSDAGGEGGGFITVGQVVESLIHGTLKPELRQVLQRRLDYFLAAWKPKLGEGGEGYRISTEKLSEHRRQI